MPERAFSLVSRRIQILKYFWMRYFKSKARDHLFWVSVETLALFQQFAVPASGARRMGTINWRFLEYFYSRLIDSNLGHTGNRETLRIFRTPADKLFTCPASFLEFPCFSPPRACVCRLPGWLMTPVMKISDILHMKNL